MVKSTVDPLSEDDFDKEVKLDAAQYSARHSHHDQKGSRKQGKRRKVGADEGSKKDQEKILSVAGGNDISKYSSSKSYLLGSDDDSDGWVDQSRRKGRKASRWDGDFIGSDPSLTYEGQVQLPFNPLYKLAGMLEVEPQVRKPTSSAPSITPVSPASVATRHKNRNNEREFHEVDPLCEKGDADDEYCDEEAEEVYLPSMTIPSRRASIPSNKQADQDVYSDDDMFTTSQQKLPARGVSHTEESANDQDVPEVKPNLFNEKFKGILGEPLYLGDSSLDPSVPAPLNRYLKEYQREGIKFFYRKYTEGRGAILGDDMGLGKTIQVIGFLSAIMRKTGTSADYMRRKATIRNTDAELKPKHWPTALIVCPKFLLRNWERELQTWGYFEVETWQSDNWASTKKTFERGYLDIILASYESVRMHIQQLKDMPFSVVIADEAHRLKEPRAAVTLAMKMIKCSSCFALSGTIIQNRLDEMWSILDFVDRGWAGTLKEWRSFVVDPIKKGHRHEGTVKEVVTAIMRLGVMHDKVLPHFYLRRDKRLIANELPDKRDLVVFCPLAPNQIEAYRRFLASEDVQFILRRFDLCECGSGEARSDCCHKTTSAGEVLRDVLLKSINALSKIANHLGLLYHARDDNQHTREVNQRIFKQAIGMDYDQKRQNVATAALDPGNCGKWKLLAELLRQWRREEGDNKVLIFSNSVRLLKMIAEFISTDLSFPFEMITGEVGVDDRMFMIDRFQDPQQDQYVLLISTMAGGVGLNLTAANKVVIFDPAWNPANDLQAMDRAFRLGQKRTVDVYRLIGQGTLEELVYERQIQKQQRSRQLNEGTFESRIHQGMDRGRNAEEQGELFGSHNIFRFDPAGFVPGRLERVRQAEDRFVQDLIDAEYDEEEALEEDAADEINSRARDVRRQRDQARAVDAAKKRRQDNAVVQTVLGYGDEEKPRKEDDVLRSFGINSQAHDTAFRDSPEERKIYELGLKLLKANPEIAATLKANDLGKVALAKPRQKKQELKRRRETDPDEEPWKARIAEGKKKGATVLAELSD